MKKNIFTLLCLTAIHFITAQGVDKYGRIITDATLNSLEVGTVIYPNTNGTDNQVLTTNGSGNATWKTQNFVDLSTDQTIGGIKTFSSDAIVNGLTVGRGNGILGTSATNTAIGRGALLTNDIDGFRNTAIGQYTLRANKSGDNNTAIGSEVLTANISGQENTALGIKSLFSNNIGSFNTASGVHSLYSNIDGQQNTAFGYAALEKITVGSDNAALGASAGRYIFDGETSNTKMNKSVLIGGETKPLADDGVNEIVIGFQAIGNGSNTMQLGNSEIINVKTSGTITADTVTYPKAHGASGQVLSTTGSGTLTWLTPSTTATAYNGILPVLNGGTGSSTQNFVDLTTAQNVGGAKKFISNDGLFATGTFESGATSSLGLGIRMMWYPKKAAFRAGNVNGTEWDDTNIGLYSTAFNNSTIASGNISFASGHLNTASGNTSTAMGYRNTASGEIATTIGDSNTASGNISIAMGYSTKARSYAETVIGSYNTDYTPSSISLFNPNDRLFVIGNGTSEATNNALVMLKNGNTTFSGQITTSIDAVINGLTLGKGGNNLEFNTAIGKNALASATVGSEDQGHYNTATGESSLTINSTGSYNTAFGFGSGSTITTGSRNTLIGVNAATSANGINATAIGNGATAGSNTVQLGNEFVTGVFTSGSMNATAFNITSDIRLKREIKPIESTVKQLLQLRPVTYIKKTSLASEDYFIKENGFIAQEIKEVFPDVVIERNDKDKLLSVNYASLIPILTKAIQEQQKEIENLRVLVEKLIIQQNK